MAPFGYERDSPRTEVREVDGTGAPVFVPYTRFLERRAWRAKIADDFRRLAAQELSLPVSERLSHVLARVSVRALGSDV